MPEWMNDLLHWAGLIGNAINLPAQVQSGVNMGICASRVRQSRQRIVELTEERQLQLGEIVWLTGVHGVVDGDEFTVTTIHGSGRFAVCPKLPYKPSWKGRPILNPPSALRYAFDHGWTPNPADLERLYAGKMSEERMDVIVRRAKINLQRRAFKACEYLPRDERVRMDEAWNEWGVPCWQQERWQEDITLAFRREMAETDRFTILPPPR